MAHTPCPLPGCWRKRSRVVSATRAGNPIRRCSGGHMFVLDKHGWDRTILVKKG